MLINRLQSTKTFRELNLPEVYLKNLSEHSTDESLNIIAKVTASMLRHLNLPEDKVSEFTGQVKERKMAEPFENFKDIDLPAARKKAREHRADGQLHTDPPSLRLPWLPFRFRTHQLFPATSSIIFIAFRLRG